MKYTQLNAFEKHLVASAPDHFAELYLVIGSDEVLCQEALDLLVHHIGITTKLESKQLTEEKLLTEVKMPSFFDKQRVLFIPHAEELKPPVQKALEKLIASPFSSLSLVLQYAKLSSQGGFYKKAEKRGIILDFPQEKPWEKEEKLFYWIQEKLRKENKQIEQEAAFQLIRAVGQQREMIQMELEKLICYVGDNPLITSDAVAQILVSQPEENLWQFGDLVLQKKGAAALKHLHLLWKEDSTFFQLLPILRWQFQQSYQVVTHLMRGGSEAELAYILPKLKGKRLQRQIQFAKGYGVSRLKLGLKEIGEMEFIAKDQMINRRLLMQQLVLQLVR